MDNGEIRRVADDALAHLEYRARPTGDGSYWVKRHDAPGWFTDLVYAAHDYGRVLPDDRRYEMLVSILDRLSKVDDDEDLYEAGVEWAEEYRSVHYSELCRWLTPSTMSYVDEAAEDGLVAADATIEVRLAAGQYREANEVWTLVVWWFQNYGDDFLLDEEE